MALNPAGTLLVAAATLSFFNYTINADGTLTALSSTSGQAPYPPSGLWQLWFNAAGTFLYAPASINSTIAIYPVGGDGRHAG